MSNTNYDIHGITRDDDLEVDTPAGATFPVMNEDERDYFIDITTRYMTDNIFTNVTDLQDLDKIVCMELLCWRWHNWLSREKDYWGDPIDPAQMQKYINEFSKEVRYLKKNINIDKSSRDKEKSESVSAYIHSLGVRAKEFGIMRNEQAVKAITLFKELQSLITLHDNCTPEERREKYLLVSQEDIFNWIRTRAIPEMDEIDAKFRAGSQTYWIDEM